MERYTDMIYNTSLNSGDPVTMDTAAPSTSLIQDGLCDFSPLEKLKERRQWRDKRVAALAKLKKQMDSEDKQNDE